MIGVMDREEAKKKIRHNGERLLTVVRWTIFSLVTGLALGVIGALFAKCISFVTEFRLAHRWVIFCLPFGAVLILWLYRLLHDEKDGGTNLVIEAIHADENIPLRMSPLIFVSTVLSHFCGASVGRETECDGRSRRSAARSRC